MSQISVNDITSLDGKSGPVISGITTVSSTGYMMVPAGDTRTRIVLPNENIVTDGLVLYLDAGKAESFGGDGTTWRDLSGENNNGTLTNGVGFTEDYGGSLIFDGVDDYIDFTSEPNLNGKSFSAGCWFKTTDADMRLIQNASTGAFGTKTGFQISVVDNTFGNTAVTNSSGNSVAFGSVSSTPYIDGNWHFICLTFNTTTGRAELYLDGNFSGFGINSGLIGANMNGVGLEIGRANSSFQYLTGNISNAFMYNKALSAAEVLQNYNATKYRYEN